MLAHVIHQAVASANTRYSILILVLACHKTSHTKIQSRLYALNCFAFNETPSRWPNHTNMACAAYCNLARDIIISPDTTNCICNACPSCCALGSLIVNADHLQYPQPSTAMYDYPSCTFLYSSTQPTQAMWPCTCCCCFMRKSSHNRLPQLKPPYVLSARACPALLTFPSTYSHIF